MITSERAGDLLFTFAHHITDIIENDIYTDQVHFSFSSHPNNPLINFHVTREVSGLNNKPQIRIPCNKYVTVTF